MRNLNEIQAAILQRVIKKIRALPEKHAVDESSIKAHTREMINQAEEHLQLDEQTVKRLKEELLDQK